MGLKKSDYPYRIVMYIPGRDENYDSYKWLFENVGYGGNCKTGVKVALNEWYAAGNTQFTTDEELWTVVADKKWHQIKLKFYFKEKSHAALFKLIWSGMEE